MERKVFEAEVKEANEKDLTVVHFISTEKKDRGGDIMRADGMKIKGKPVVLLAHGFTNMGTEPVARPIWIRKGEFKGNKGVMAKTQFYPDDVGKRLWGKTSQGFMPNWSIGYVPLKVEDIKDGRDIKEWELLEYSPVGVPMNPDAQSLEMQGMVFKMMQEGDQKEEDFGDLIAWKDAEGNWEEKPYANEHACRLNDPDKYIRIRRQNNKFGDGIHALWGVQEGDKPVELQAIRFSAGKFSVDKAKSWLKEHEYKCKGFEAATGKVGDEIICKGCRSPISYLSLPEEGKGYVKCPKCDSFIDQYGNVVFSLEYVTSTEPNINITVEGDDKIDLLTKEVKALKEQMASLIALVQPDTQDVDNKDADGKNLQEQTKKTLVIVDKGTNQEKEQQEKIAQIKSIVAEVLNEKAKQIIDELKGKVK